MAVAISVGPLSKPISKPLLKAGPTTIFATALLEAVTDTAENGLELIELKQKMVVAYNGLGVTFYLRERYAEAEKAYKKAIEIDPMYPDTYYNLACLFSLQQNKEQAFRYLKMAFLNGYIDVQTLDTDNDLDNLRDDPRFEALKNGTF